jgi:N-acetylglutamate synthase-like GNAT family acetyltransferase
VEISLRQASPDDSAPVSALLAGSYPRLMAAAYDDALLLRVLPRITKANPSLLASGSYFIAETKPYAVVGCGGWTHEKPGSGETVTGIGHIRHFATDAGWTDRGIGRSIYDRCEMQARTAGIKTFECYSSLNAEAFYAALGFAVIDRIDVPMGDGLFLPSLHMRRQI